MIYIIPGKQDWHSRAYQKSQDHHSTVIGRYNDDNRSIADCPVRNRYLNERAEITTKVRKKQS